MPTDFFNKFIDIEIVKIDGKVNQADLIEFLQKCIHLYWIFTVNANLDQAFFDDLKQIKALELLTLDELEWRIESHKFLDDLPNLKSIDIYHSNLPIDFISNLFRKCKYVDTLHYRNVCFNSIEHDVNLSIYKELDQTFEITYDNENFHKIKTMQEVINFLRNDEKTKDFLNF